MKITKILIVVLLIVSALSVITILRLHAAKETGLKSLLIERDELAKKANDLDGQIRDLKKAAGEGERISYQLKKKQGEIEGLQKENARYKRDMEKAETAYNTLWDDYQNVKLRQDEAKSGAASPRSSL